MRTNPQSPTTLYEKCNPTASINYSIACKFKPIDIYRLFCVSLLRDKWYYSRATHKEIAELSQTKTDGNFAKVFSEFLDKKHYRDGDGCREYNPLRCVYSIPAMELKCVSINKTFTQLDLDAKIKGLLIQLYLLQRYSGVSLTRQFVRKELNISTSTLNKYLLELQAMDLIQYNSNGEIIVTPNQYFEASDFRQQKLASKRELEIKSLPNITFNSKS